MITVHVLIYFTEFEPLIRKKKKSVVTTDRPTSTCASKSASSSIGKYGTSFSGPIHSMSSFIQSALAESTPDSASTAEASKAASVKASSSASSASAAAKRRGSQRLGQRAAHSRKKAKLGECVNC